MSRQVGRIKWFGGVNRKTGRENHFGFIARAGKTDLYVHCRDVRCAIAQLTEDIPVTFELSEEPGSLYAVAVGLLQDETDLNMLADCFESNEYIQFVAQRYLNALDPEQAIAAITRRFPSLSQEQQASWLRHIIGPRLMLPHGFLLYPLLPFDQQIKFYKRRLIQAEPEARLSVAKEIIEAAKRQLTTASEKSAIINQVPRPILYLPEAAVLRSYLPGLKRVELCREILQYHPHADYALEEAVGSFQNAYAIPPAFHQTVATALTQFFQSDSHNSNQTKAKEPITNQLPEIVTLLPVELLLAKEGRLLRRHLPTLALWQLYLTAKQQNDHFGQERIIVDLTARQKKEFWLYALPHLTDTDPLLAIAPPAIKLQWLKEQYLSLTEVIEGCITGGKLPEQRGHIYEWTPKEMVNGLTEQDWRLARLWTPPADESRQDAYTAQMLSARMAELAAKRFYRALGFICKDVAITQLDGIGDDWKTHDLLLTGNVPIDVKNARTPYHDNMGYVEHCIPKFKKDRNRQDVIIAGVLSPYLTLKEFRDPGSLTHLSQDKSRKRKSKPIRHITVLGEVTYDKLSRLQNHFTSPGKFDLHLAHMATFPPWIFDFPDRFYAQQQEYAARLRTTASGQLPSWTDMKLLHSNPLPAFVAANAPLPESWLQTLTLTQLTLYNKLCQPKRNDQRISLPFLYLTILTDFLEHLHEPEANSGRFLPKEYETLLYADTTSRSLPLGIADPLDIIRNLIDSLIALWRANNRSLLQSFRIFKFHGLGLLRGRAKERDDWTTILAYCGGEIDGIGKCGKRPLIYGAEQTCHVCKRLICPKCGFCEKGCPEYAKRKDDQG